MNEHHLSSLVIHARPERLAEVSRSLLAEGCEIHVENPAGKLVVTLEAASQGALNDCLTRIQLLPGVLAATLVFHHVEDAPEPAEIEP
jgi:nitrate reductase NapD